jgi:hypothetical protein
MSERFPSTSSVELGDVDDNASLTEVSLDIYPWTMCSLDNMFFGRSVHDRGFPTLNPHMGGEYRNHNSYSRHNVLGSVTVWIWIRNCRIHMFLVLMDLDP